ncbi:MAG: hypothetical protein AAF590_02825 [Pseudomonadota bacterium]
MDESDLPPLALSVRQPWAWAILFGGKVIENRSLGSIRSGKLDCRRIALHAASGMTEEEYRWGYSRLSEHGVTCPLPADLPRGAIIGAVTVVDIISQSDSPWFGSKPGNQGLVLDDPVCCDPIAVTGALGYFQWAPLKQPSTGFPPTKSWMKKYAKADAAKSEPQLFGELPLHFKSKPKKPFK